MVHVHDTILLGRVNIRMDEYSRLYLNKLRIFIRYLGIHANSIHVQPVYARTGILCKQS